MSDKSRPLTWRRSIGCGSGGCVESAADTDTVYLRDSKDARSPVLEFSHEAWRAFIAGLKRDTFASP